MSGTGLGRSRQIGELLHRDGSNVASVIARLKTDHPGISRRIADHLSEIVPGIAEVGRKAFGSYETEPETALHPAAAEILMNALREASDKTQALITTHSPDLLDQLVLERDGLFAVQARKGTTEVGPVDKASVEAIRRHLYTPGELLRMDPLEPDRTELQHQLRLLPFESEKVPS